VEKAWEKFIYPKLSTSSIDEARRIESLGFFVRGVRLSFFSFYEV